MAGGCVGLVVGLLLGGAIALASGAGPRSLSLPQASLWFGLILAALGAVLGAVAEVRGADEPSESGRPASAPESARDAIVGFVWPKAHATPEGLAALGRELESWRASHPLVTRIDGLEELLSGRYPMPDGPTPYAEDPAGELMPVPRRGPDGPVMEFRRMAVVDPWRHCPALAWATEGLTSEEAIASLRRAIPPGLVDAIGYSFD